VQITVYNITGETDVYVEGTSRSKVPYNVIYPSNIVTPYIQFTPNNDHITEGDTFRCRVDWADDVAISENQFEITDIKVQYNESGNTVTTPFGFPANIQINDVNSHITIIAEYQTFGRTYNVYGLQLGNGYTWAPPSTQAAENMPFTISIDAVTGYELSSVKYTHNNIEEYGTLESNNKRCVINIPNVQSDIVFEVESTQVYDNTIYLVDLAPSSSGIKLKSPAQIFSGRNYSGMLDVIDKEQNVLPDSISIVGNAGAIL